MAVSEPMDEAIMESTVVKREAGGAPDKVAGANSARTDLRGISTVVISMVCIVYVRVVRVFDLNFPSEVQL